MDPTNRIITKSYRKWTVNNPIVSSSQCFMMHMASVSDHSMHLIAAMLVAQ